ncbi:MAG: TolC family protein [Bacteroidota bacterium]|nr:TolC family protein [Bacteroidota bacterium]
MQKIVVALLTFFSPIFAQSQTTIVSYDEAVKLALEQNLLIKREENQLNIFRADKLETQGRFIPSVSLNGNADQTSGRQFDLTSGQLVTQTSQRLSMGVNASLVLFDGFNRINSIKQAQYNFQAQQNSRDRIKQQVVFLTTQQFLQVLLDKELVKIAAQNLEEQKILLERLKEFSDVGTVPITDYYNQNAAVKRLEMELLQAQNQLLSDKAIFAQTIQFDPKSDFTLKEPVWVEKKSQLDQFNLFELYELALENRKDFKQQNLITSAENLNIRIARGQLLPSLSAYYNYGTGFSSVYKREDPETKLFDVVPLADQLFSDNLFSSFGVSLRVPILDNFSTRARISRAKNFAENQQLVAEDLKRTIFNEVQGAYLDYNAMTDRYEAAEETIQAAELAFNAQKERFAIGLGNLLEYTAANTALVRGQSELVQAQFSLAFQKSILDYYTGTLAINQDVN